MKKISKITLENFRAFLGKKEIDFNNTEKNPLILYVFMGRMVLEKHLYLIVLSGSLLEKLVY